MSNPNIRRHLVICYYYVISICHFFVPIANAEESNDSKIGSTEAAYERALEITGFSENRKELQDLEKLVIESIFIDSTTPFLSKEINGRAVWVLSFDNVDIRPQTAIDRGTDIWEKQSFFVYLDKETGKVLQIHSKSVINDSSVLPEANANEAEEILRNKGEIYHGIPEYVPKVPFHQAIQQAVGCCPLVAKEIIAQLILHSYNGNESKPVWNIICRGIPPVGISKQSQEASIKSRNRARCVVDAETGEWIFMTSSPHSGSTKK